jgi:hypothetical protein
MVVVKVDFKDKKGKIIGDTLDIVGTIKPGETARFRLVTYDSDVLKNADSYELYFTQR